MAGSADGQISILTSLALQIRPNQWFSTPKSLRQIEIICNTLDWELVRRFVDGHSYVIHIQRTEVAKDKHVLGCTVPRWLRDFLFDPHRSRRLYSTSLVIGECQQTIEAFIATNSGFYPVDFFVQDDGISAASRLLEHIKNGSDSKDLLLFLGYLSEIDWLDIYTRGRAQSHLTHGIMHWVCTTLVSYSSVIRNYQCNLMQEPSSLEPGPLRDAMQKISTAILPCATIPVLGQESSQVNQLGIFEDPICLGCRQDDIPRKLFPTDGCDILLRILPMCTGQIFFQTLCTRIVESILLEMVREMFRRYLYLYSTCGCS